MEFNHNEVKRVGEFVVKYPDNETVAISYMGFLGTLSTQLLTLEKVQGTLTPTGTFCNLDFNGFSYPAIIFHLPQNISQEELEVFLEEKED